MEWEALFERERSRSDDGEARLDPGQLDDGQLVRLGNAAYGAGLTLLMLGRDDEAHEWLHRAATRWRESWEYATPTSWGRPIGTIKATLIAGRLAEARAYARWTLGLGTETAESPIGRYADCLALLTLGRWPDARHAAYTLRGREDFPPAVAEALATISEGDATGYAGAVGAIVESFETREEYLEDVPVADTALAVQVLAAKRGIAAELRPSPVLPPSNVLPG